MCFFSIPCSVWLWCLPSPHDADSGLTINAAIKVLNDHGVTDSRITILNLFAVESGIQTVLTAHPDVSFNGLDVCFTLAGAYIDKHCA